MKMTIGIDEIPNCTPVLTATTRTVLLADRSGQVFAFLKRIHLTRPDDGWEAYTIDHKGNESHAASGASYELAVAMAYEARPVQVNWNLGYTSRPMLHRVVYSDSLRLSGSGEWSDQ